MASHAVAWMTGASAAAAAVLLFALGDVVAVALGTLGPLAAAVMTWLAVTRARRRSPAEVSAVMIRLFGAKMALVPLYVAGVVLLTPADRVAFVASFACQLILLYAIEALCLRRLFAGEAQEWPAG